MNQQFTDLVKGRNDGLDILKALTIQEDTKPTKKVKDGILKAVELIDSGVPLADAAAQVLGENQPSTITVQESKEIASQEPGSIAPQEPESIEQTKLPPETQISFEEAVRAIADSQLDDLPERLAEQCSTASDNFDEAVGRPVTEIWFDQAAKKLADPTLPERTLELIKSGKFRSSRRASG